MTSIPMPAAAPAAEPASPAPAGRIASVDLIRGAVMILMALDHVRVYSGVPPGGPAPGVFFTRWITHFAAPGFCFLAGTGAYLHRQKLGDKSALARYLVTRGAFLISLEFTLSRFSWTFNFDYHNYTEGNVLWAFGWCMILLAALIRLPVALIGALGVLVIAGHNLIDPHARELAQGLQGSPGAWLWQVLYFGGAFRIGGSGPQLVILYSIIPWVGVMAAGYGFGAIMRMERRRRHRLCLALGLGAVAAFLILRAGQIYGDPRPWRGGGTGGGAGGQMPALLAFLNATKYPASLLFLLMTLGPTIASIPLLERAHGRAAGWISVFGRVPLFYYLLHIPLIHLIAVLISLVRTPASTPWLFENHPLLMSPVPAGYTYSLPLLYLVTAIAVVLLYFPCHWFARLKATRRDPWLSYL